ncbi:hypothetical protein SLS64_010771 [Diaporthe eres]
MKLLGLSLGRLWQLRQSTGSDDDGYVPEYLLDRFVEILELSGEQQALRFLRESKARAARESRSSNRSRRKRRNAMMGMSDESRISSMDRVIDDDLSAFGITSVQNARGQIMMAGSSRRRENVNSSPALNRTIEIHIDDDLVGAAESSTPVEKFRRLMNSSPTQKNPKKKKRAKALRIRANALTRLARDWIDVYYDNVEGGQLEAALTRMNDFGNIVSSGKISVSQPTGQPEENKYGHLYRHEHIFLKCLTINGFVYTDPALLGKYMASFPADMVTWLAQGKMKTKEEVFAGVDEEPRGD